MSAEARAAELMRLPMRGVPPLALALAEHLARHVGMCAETLLTAYAAYAQVIEGLPCDDDLYRVRPDVRAWLEQTRAGGER